MKENFQIKRTRCDVCRKPMVDTELHINNPYIFFGGMNPIQWQENVFDGIKTEGIKIFMETQSSYIGGKEFCGAHCLDLFLKEVVEKAEKQEAIFKMQELKQ